MASNVRTTIPFEKFYSKKNVTTFNDDIYKKVGYFELFCVNDVTKVFAMHKRILTAEVCDATKAQ